MRVRVLAMAGGLLVSACAEQPAIYADHSYTCCVETLGTSSWPAGQTLTLHWQPTPPARTTDPTRHSIVLSLSLTGPFANVDLLKQAITQSSKPAGARTISASPVWANDRIVESPASQLHLPADLPPGFYNLASQAAEGGNVFGGAAIVKIIAPDQP